MEWRATLDSEIAAGDILLSVETDKAVVDVPSPVAGRLVKQSVGEGDEVATGTVVAVIEQG